MSQKNEWLQRIAEGFDLPMEGIPGQTVVELAGDQRVLVENHMGVSQYSQDSICVNVKYGVLVVYGSDLQLMRMSAEQLIIAGHIDGIQLFRRKG